MAEARRGYNPLDGAETPTDKPCKICTDFRTYAKMRSMHKFLEKKESKQKENDRGCPLDREELGRNTWSFIHTLAAYYPEKPNPKQQEDMKQFIHLFAKLFPCDDCSQDLQNRISQELPDTSSRYTLSQWWCRRHNEINEKLGKPKFDCSLVDQRWRDGWKDGSCD